MVAPSAVVKVNGSLLPTSGTTGADVTAGSTLTIVLNNQAGVNTWDVNCTMSDGVNPYSAYPLVEATKLVINATTIQFTMPALFDPGTGWHTGASMQFISVVNAGQFNANTYVFGVFVRGDSHLRLVFDGENLETNATYGVAPDLNPDLVGVAFGPAGGDLQMYYPNPNVQSLSGTAAGSYGIQVNTQILEWANINGNLIQPTIFQARAGGSGPVLPFQIKAADSSVINQIAGNLVLTAGSMYPSLGGGSGGNLILQAGYGYNNIYDGYIQMQFATPTTTQGFGVQSGVDPITFGPGTMQFTLAPTIGVANAIGDHGHTTSIIGQAGDSGLSGGDLVLSSGLGVSNGIIQMQLGGTDALDLNSTGLAFSAGFGGPTFTQTRPTGVANGSNLTIAAQFAGTTSGNGGNLILSAGGGNFGSNGNVVINTSATQVTVSDSNVLVNPNLLLNAAINWTNAVVPRFSFTGINMASDANYTLTSGQYNNLEINVTSSVSLTTTRNIVFPLGIGALFIIRNSTTGGQAIRVIGSSGAGTTISNGAASVIWCDGTNYFSAGSSSGSITWADDLGGSTSSDQWIQSISGNGGSGGTVKLNIVELQFANNQLSPIIDQQPYNNNSISTPGSTGQTLIIESQAGQNLTGSISPSFGGIGGALTLLAGPGGSNIAVSSTGGVGGITTLSGGAGGDNTTAPISGRGGAGGNTIVQAGAGGGGGNISHPGIGGAGGNLFLAGGLGGAAPSGTAGTDGYIVLQTGGVTRIQITDVYITIPAFGSGIVQSDAFGNLSSSSAIVVTDIGHGTADQLIGTNHAGTASEWFTLGGDATLASHSLTVTGLQTHPVESQSLGASQDGYVLTWHNAGPYWYAAPSTGGGGAVTWANDLVGSTNAGQYVAAISGNAGAGGTVPLNITTLQFGGTQLNTALNQAAQASTGSGSGATGTAMFIQAQAGQDTTASSATGGTGGSLYIAAGDGGNDTGGGISYAGAGGTLYLRGGNANSNNSGPPSIGGDLIISPGLGHTNGSIQFGEQGLLGSLATLNSSGFTVIPPVTLTSLNGSGSGFVAVSNAGLLSFVSGVTPSGTAGGDLSGTYPNPTVAQAQGGDIIFNTTSIEFATSVSSPQLYQNATSSANGQNLTVLAQNTTHSGSNGGNLYLSSGSATNGTDGYVALQVGGVDQFQVGPNSITIPNFIGATAGVVHNSAAGVLSSSLIVNADVATAAAIAVSKLAAGSNGQILTTSGGVPTWAADPATVTWASDLNTSTNSNQYVVSISGSNGTGSICTLNVNQMQWASGLAGGLALDVASMASTSSGSGAAGQDIYFIAQPGQNATGASHNGGAGGTVHIASGAGGTSGSATAGNAGDIAFVLGASSADDNDTELLRISGTTVGNVTFTNTVAIPNITQTALTSTSGGSGSVGKNFSITAQAGQAATGASHNGGNGGELILSTGAGGTSGSATAGTAGTMLLQTGGSTQVTITPASVTLASLAGSNQGVVIASSTGVLSSSIPNQDGYLYWSGSAFQWLPVSGGGGTITLSGDVTGSGTSSIATTVVALQGNAVASQSLGTAQDGYVLTWVNGSTQWQAKPANPDSEVRTITSSYQINSATGTADDYHILCNNSGAITVTLPKPVSGATFEIWDIAGTAETNNITLAPYSTEKISGVAANRTLQTNWGHWKVLSNGTDWFLTG